MPHSPSSDCASRFSLPGSHPPPPPPPPSPSCPFDQALKQGTYGYEWEHTRCPRQLHPFPKSLTLVERAQHDYGSPPGAVDPIPPAQTSKHNAKEKHTGGGCLKCRRWGIASISLGSRNGSSPPLWPCFGRRADIIFAAFSGFALSGHPLPRAMSARLRTQGHGGVKLQLSSVDSAESLHPFLPYSAAGPLICFVKVRGHLKAEELHGTVAGTGDEAPRGSQRPLTNDVNISCLAFSFLTWCTPYGVHIDLIPSTDISSHDSA